MVNHHNPHGFTLVELAIALMVIGLLIGGVLKGQELIENAKITSVIRQAISYDAATLIFKNTYGALPGDTKRPNRIPNCNDALCVSPGNGNGRVKLETGLTPNMLEFYNFLPHLTKAGMIQGPQGRDTPPTSINDYELFFAMTALDLLMYVEEGSFADGQYTSGTKTSHHSYKFSKASSTHSGVVIPVRTMVQIDTKVDDGKPHSGDVQVFGSLCPTLSIIDTSDENEYASDDTFQTSGRGGNSNCTIIIRAGF